MLCKKIFQMTFFLSCTVLTACGGGTFYTPPSYIIGPNADVSTSELQIHRQGDPQPLSSLEGVHVGDVVFLEVEGGNLQTSLEWFSSNVSKGMFLHPGELHLTGAGTFEVSVFAGAEKKILPVKVEAKPPDTVPEGQSPSPTLSPEQSPQATPTESPVPPTVKSDPFMDEVVSFQPGAGAGFGSDRFPSIVLGAPQGGGLQMGGEDVLSLGMGGSIVLKSDIPILNGAGTDFIVFENPFNAAGDPRNPFVEPGEVSVSQDGVHFFTFPCASEDREAHYPGCAGVHPVMANSETNDIDPTDPNVAGGDDFDLKDLGLNWIQYIQIHDLSNEDPGKGNSAGFDLDAISIVHQ
jgi:hypothetical protein